MNAAQQLQSLGQGLWLDGISREVLIRGALREYISQLSVTGVTSSSALFDNAIRASDSYDVAICHKTAAGQSGQDILYELALEDLTHAARQLKAVHDSTHGRDGWVSQGISPLLANDTAGSIREASVLHTLAQCSNLLIEIPGTAAGVTAIEECIFRGIPVNATLLFSPQQYIAAAEAYMRGIKRRIGAGMDPCVVSVASIFVSGWDVAVHGALPDRLRNRLGIAMAGHIYKAYSELLGSARWQMLGAAGAMAQRVLWASTGTRDPLAPDTLYVEALAAPDTIITVPEATLLAFAAHGHVRGITLFDGTSMDELQAALTRKGIVISELAARLQREGTDTSSRSWHDMLGCIARKSVPTGYRGSYGIVRAM